MYLLYASFDLLLYSDVTASRLYFVAITNGIFTEYSVHLLTFLG